MFKCFTRPQTGRDAESLIERTYDCYEISDQEAKKISEEKAANNFKNPSQVKTIDGKTYIWIEEHEEGRKIAIAPINILGHWGSSNNSIKKAIMSAITPNIMLVPSGLEKTETFRETLAINCSYMNWYTCSWYPSFNKMTKDAPCKRFRDFVSADNAEPTALVQPLRIWQFPFAKWIIAGHIKEYYQPKEITIHYDNVKDL